jgi:photosystem II stability/assembly factor-like uncharacterized protein
VYIGGIKIFKTTDGGTTWSNVSELMHPDQHGISVSATNPSLVVVANDGGVYASTNAGATWHGANGVAPNALAITQAYRGTAHPSDPDGFYIGTQDNGEDKFSGSLSWREVFGGDGGYTELDYQNPDTVYEEYIYLDMWRSDDAGNTWHEKITGIDQNDAAEFIAPFVMDPNVPSTLYAATNRVYRTVNRGDTWAALSGPLSPEAFSAVAVSRSDSNTLYAGNAEFAAGRSGIWVTRDGGATWRGPFGSANGLPPFQTLADLQVDPVDANLAYATYGGFTGSSGLAQHVFKTSNGGLTWVNVSLGLPDIPVNSLAIDPAHHNIVYIGTDIGVFKSTDAGGGWSTLNASLPNVAVWHLVLNRAGTHLFAATHGRSVYRLSRFSFSDGLVSLLSVPQRLVDTRTNGGAISTGASRCFTLTGLTGIPTDAGAVVLNVTAVSQTTNGWVTVYPNGQPLPATSTLNFGPSEYAMANIAIVRVGAGGQVCANVGTVNTASGSAQVILDAVGFLSAGALAQLSMLNSPQRIADTRIAGGSIGTGNSRCFPIGGFAGIPADAAAVVLNVTAVGYSTNGWLTAYPNGQSVPTTSTLNFDRSEYAMANGAIVRLGAGGQVCVNVGTINSVPGTSDVVLDATGYVTSSALAQLPMLTTPQRVVDTRANGGPIGTGGSRCFPIAGVGGVPASATGVVLNVTAAGYDTKGWLTTYPNGQPVPATSTLNFDPSEYAMANGAIVSLGAGGQLCVSVGTINSVPGSAQVILDVTGYVSP